ncbi:MAG: hypothetical protein GC164_12315 [Phycisphaera sp.]|nr:hypothetical protein [Phycisphaera sp.]
MDHITVPIPDGLAEEQKRDLTGYLDQEVERITGNLSAIDDKPEVRDEITRLIRRGMAEVESGQGINGQEALQRIAGRHGLTAPR